ncbi:membrane-associated progesterone receptor component 2 [Hydra vulgaris]|uniref:Membrane-associated progesterone receptor component 2 n=1 Tax=Hydra vulgaris TaxID=6087 RepID=T2MIW9_HYDVU|nr:membrane-associated progesterone receptor component 2 [Hydra vulgaris]
MSTFLSSLSDYITLPVLVGLLIGVVLVIIKILLTKKPEDDEFVSKHEELPPMPKRDFTVTELRHYNGINDPRILIAVNGKVFDVTSGKQNYGPNGPYSVFAGRDASRGLGMFSIDASTVKDDYDDLSDLNSMQMDSVLEWEMQFRDKYACVGKLLKPGEKHCNYKAEESEDEGKTESEKKSD